MFSESVRGGCSCGGTVSRFAWSQSVDDVLVEAHFLGLSSGSEAVDDVLVEAHFLGLCSRSQSVEDALVEAHFLGLCSGNQSLMMLLWRHIF